MTALDYFSDAQSHSRPLVPRIVRYAMFAYAILAVTWSAAMVIRYHPTAEQLAALCVLALPEIGGGVLAWRLGRQPVPRWAVLGVLGTEIAFAVSDLGNGHGLAFVQLIVPVALTVLVARDRTPDVWATTRPIRLRRRSTDDQGGSVVEYAALVVLAALILGGLTALGVQTQLQVKTEATICHIMHGGEKGGACASVDAAAAGTDDHGKDDSGGGHKSKCSGFVGFFKCLGKGIGDFFKGFGDTVAGFFKGVGKTIAGMFEGIGKIFTDPVGFFKGIGYAITHPVDTLKNIFTGDAIENFKNGNIGEGLGDLFASAGSLLIPGAGEAGALGKLGKLGKTGKGGKNGKDGKDGKGDPGKSAANDAAKQADDALKAGDKSDLKGAQNALKNAEDDLKKAKDDAKKDGCAIALAPFDVPSLPHLGRFAAPMGPACSKDDKDAVQKAQDAVDIAKSITNRLRTQKDIDDALKNGRYEDADNLIGKLRDDANDARKRADDRPDDANNRAARAAERAADEANRKVINSKVDNALKSADPNKKVEGDVGDALRDHLTNFEKKYGKNGKDGEIDAETDKAIIEIANGKKAGGKAAQINRNKNSAITNPSGKPVIMYAPNMKTNALNMVRKETGSVVVRNMDELKQALRDLGETI